LLALRVHSDVEPLERVRAQENHVLGLRENLSTSALSIVRVSPRRSILSTRMVVRNVPMSDILEALVAAIDTELLPV
jgi:hypothetical protein